MEFRDEFDAVYDGGVFRPEGPVNLPEKTRVRLRVEDDPAATTGGGARLRSRMKALIAAKAFRPSGPPCSRDELHERR